MKRDSIKILLAFVLCWFCAACGIASDTSKELTEVMSEPPSPAVVSEMASEAIAEKTPAPVTDAFGIPLGKRFEPCMVAKVISQGKDNYLGLDKAKYQGTLYRVEPRIPNSHFTRYAVRTTKEGVIYNIEAEYEDPEKQNRCEQTKHLAELLEGKYGKPRGKGMLGDWYAFRESATGPYKGVRFYTPKCRIGRYSISYTDDNAKQVELPPLPEPTEMSGL